MSAAREANAGRGPPGEAQQRLAEAPLPRSFREPAESRVTMSGIRGPPRVWTSRGVWRAADELSRDRSPPQMNAKQAAWSEPDLELGERLARAEADGARGAARVVEAAET